MQTSVKFSVVVHINGCMAVDVWGNTIFKSFNIYSSIATLIFLHIYIYKYHYIPWLTFDSRFVMERF